jgi:hypothetical protein
MGDYGSFLGVAKTSPGVTIAAASGATPTIELQFRQTDPFAAWLTFDGITITSGLISAPAHDLTFRNSTFVGQFSLYLDANNNACSDCPAMNGSNIVFDGDMFNMANEQSGSGGYEGRMQILGGLLPAGITIKNSKFTTGCADGIQISGGDGVTIGPNNEFYGLIQGNCGPHVDAIQFVGTNAVGPVITGNYFHDDTTGITAYDGDNQAIVTNNVIVRIGQDSLLIAGFNSASIVEHNTVIGDDIICGYTHEADACKAVLRNNITGGFNEGGTTINGSTGTSPSFFDYNLCTAGSCAFGSYSAGAHSLSGTPTFVGGSAPTTYAGYALTSTSLGHGAASDGADIGAVP